MIICYADNTLVLAAGKDANMATARTNVQVAMVLNRINRLGLKIATRKTEAVCFQGGRLLERTPVLVVGDTQIEVASSIKYLGVMVDKRLFFGDHFDYIILYYI